MLWYVCYTSIKLFKKTKHRKGFILVTKGSMCLLQAFPYPEKGADGLPGGGVCPHQPQPLPITPPPHHTPFF